MPSSDDATTRTRPKEPSTRDRSTRDRSTKDRREGGRSEEDRSKARERAGISPWWWGLIGIGAAVLGLLPWIVTGMRLPLQNLWSSSSVTDMPFVLLPFSQYSITVLIVILLVGAAVLGLVARILRRRRGPWAFGFALTGLLIVQVVALLETTIAVASGLRGGWQSNVYLLALVGTSILAILIGAATATLIAKAPRGGAVVGLAVGAVALGPWLTSLLVPQGAMVGEVMLGVVGALRWLPAVLIGAAIVWAGLETIGRVVGAVLAIALLWVAPALITAVQSALGSRVLLHDLPELVAAGTQVFGAALAPEFALPPVIAAVVIAAVGLIARAVVTRSRAARVESAS
jgi:hypothetical protein